MLLIDQTAPTMREDGATILKTRVAIFKDKELTQRLLMNDSATDNYNVVEVPLTIFDNATLYGVTKVQTTSGWTKYSDAVELKPQLAGVEIRTIQMPEAISRPYVSTVHDENNHPRMGFIVNITPEEESPLFSFSFIIWKVHPSGTTQFSPVMAELYSRSKIHIVKDALEENTTYKITGYVHREGVISDPYEIFITTGKDSDERLVALTPNHTLHPYRYGGDIYHDGVKINEGNDVIPTSSSVGNYIFEVSPPKCLHKTEFIYYQGKDDTNSDYSIDGIVNELGGMKYPSDTTCSMPWQIPHDLRTTNMVSDLSRRVSEYLAVEQSETSSNADNLSIQNKSFTYELPDSPDDYHTLAELELSRVNVRMSYSTGVHVMYITDIPNGTPLNIPGLERHNDRGPISIAGAEPRFKPYGLDTITGDIVYMGLGEDTVVKSLNQTTPNLRSDMTDAPYKSSDAIVVIAAKDGIELNSTDNENIAKIIMNVILRLPQSEDPKPEMVKVNEGKLSDDEEVNRTILENVAAKVRKVNLSKRWVTKVTHGSKSLYGDNILFKTPAQPSDFMSTLVSTLGDPSYTFRMADDYVALTAYYKDLPLNSNNYIRMLNDNIAVTEIDTGDNNTIAFYSLTDRGYVVSVVFGTGVKLDISDQSVKMLYGNVEYTTVDVISVGVSTLADITDEVVKVTIDTILAEVANPSTSRLAALTNYQGRNEIYIKDGYGTVTADNTTLSGDWIADEENLRSVPVRISSMLNDMTAGDDVKGGADIGHSNGDIFINGETMSFTLGSDQNKFNIDTDVTTELTTSLERVTPAKYTGCVALLIRNATSDSLILNSDDVGSSYQISNNGEDHFTTYMYDHDIGSILAIAFGDGVKLDRKDAPYEIGFSPDYSGSSKDSGDILVMVFKKRNNVRIDYSETHDDMLPVILEHLNIIVEVADLIVVNEEGIAEVVDATKSDLIDNIVRDIYNEIPLEEKGIAYTGPTGRRAVNEIIDYNFPESTDNFLTPEELPVGDGFMRMSSDFCVHVVSYRNFKDVDGKYFSLVNGGHTLTPINGNKEGYILDISGGFIYVDILGKNATYSHNQDDDHTTIDLSNVGYDSVDLIICVVLTSNVTDTLKDTVVDLVADNLANPKGPIVHALAPSNTDRHIYYYSGGGNTHYITNLGTWKDSWLNLRDIASEIAFFMQDNGMPLAFMGIEGNIRHFASEDTHLRLGKADRRTGEIEVAGEIIQLSREEAGGETYPNGETVIGTTASNVMVTYITGCKDKTAIFFKDASAADATAVDGQFLVNQKWITVTTPTKTVLLMVLGYGLGWRLDTPDATTCQITLDYYNSGNGSTRLGGDVLMFVFAREGGDQSFSPTDLQRHINTHIHITADN